LNQGFFNSTNLPFSNVAQNPSPKKKTMGASEASPSIQGDAPNLGKFDAARGHEISVAPKTHLLNLNQS
jgi:hypothetical protein